MTTLAQALGATDTLQRKAALVVAGSILIAVGAQVSVPMWPVPMTLSTLAVLVVGFTLGSRLGAASVMAYLAQGAAGLPVFAGGLSAAALAGPTAGFLFGFIALAWMTGKAVELGLARGALTTAAVAIVASALLYVPGVLWLTTITPLDLNGAISAGMLPFVVGDLVKSVLVALIVTGAWTAVQRRKG